MTVRNAATEAVERIDLPMRASAGGYYGNLMLMYKHLDVPFHPVRFLFVFAKALASSQDKPLQQYQGPASSDPGSYFVHASNLHQTPPPWPGTRSVVCHLVEIMFLIICQAWFTLVCFLLPARDTETLGAYIHRVRLPRRYVSHYLLPLICSVSTCSHAEMLAFPASDVVDYKKLSHGQQHYSVCGGVHQIESRLAAGVESVRTGVRVLEVVPGNGSGATVRWQSRNDGGEAMQEAFDRVILAVSPDVVGRIFRPLKSKMERMPTRQVESSVIAPADAGVGTYTIESNDDKTAAVCMHHRTGVQAAQTICLRTLFSQSDSQTEALHTMPSGVVVSTCSLDRNVEAKSTLYSSKFTRVLRTTESREIVKSIVDRSPRNDNKLEGTKSDEWVNGEGDVWLTGAWCWDGMVLLEGCVVSAMRVAEEFGVVIPWKS